MTRSARLAATAFAGLLACAAPPADAPVVEVFLPPGSGFSQITDTLVARGVVAHPGWFRFVARAGRFDRRLKAGYYEFRAAEPALAVLRRLAAGTEKTVRFTFPEGSTLTDLGRLAAARLALPPDSVRAAATDPALLRELGLESGTLEGYLAPETYFVSRMISARELVREMARLFQRRWDPAWDLAAAAQGLTRSQLVILASIVEGEARVEEDRALVAAVYRNRLRLGMPLQADPTVQYAIELATGDRKPRLFERDYQFSSPYNTYLHPGLPPGPVGAPSRASLEAVLAPAPVPYLFFVAGPDGKHIFTRTYAEHLRAVARVRQLEREARRQARAAPAGTRGP